MKYFAIGAVALLAATSQAVAHHPFDTEFDSSKPIVFSGEVTRVDWAMPHVIIHVDAAEAGAAKKEWLLEAASPAEMLSFGWTMDTLKTGETISVSGYRAKAEPSTIAARTITLAGGQKLSAHGSDGGPEG
jgi:hypothetical protein